jgi:hypothetical protein
MDNNLPGFDITLDSPQNIIAVPLYKGFGYNVVYDNTYLFVRQCYEVTL